MLRLNDVNVDSYIAFVLSNIDKGCINVPRYTDLMQKLLKRVISEIVCILYIALYSGFL